MVGAPSGSEPTVVRSAGGVLWRRDPELRVALVHRSRYDDWSLPKGKLRRGEHPLVAAGRETVEETGHRPVVGRRLPTQRYAVAAADRPSDRDSGRRRPVPRSGDVAKVVDFWAMRDRGDPAAPRDTEVDALEWLAPGEAARRLTYAGDRDVLLAFQALPAVLSTVVLVRHARAGKRIDGDHGDDRLRPLDVVGRRQAEALRRCLVWFGPAHVYSADRVRCVDTVAPLAADLGVPVRTDPLWSEPAVATRPAGAVGALRELATGTATAVVCSQGGAIPRMLAELSREDGTALPVGDPERDPRRGGEPPARKGSAWVLAFDGGRLVAADYYPSFVART